MPIYPAHVLKDVDGARYLKEYNFKMLPGTGPYIVNEADVVKRQAASRSGDGRTTGRPTSGGTSASNNFDEIREIVVRDQNLAFEMFKRGDLDYSLRATCPRQWVAGAELRPQFSAG